MSDYCPLHDPSRLFEKLDDLKDGQSRLREDIASLRGDMSANARKTQLVAEIVTGNGKPDTGLASRLKVVEDTEGRRKWFVITAVGAAIIVLAKSLLDVMGLVRG